MSFVRSLFALVELERVQYVRAAVFYCICEYVIISLTQLLLCSFLPSKFFDSNFILFGIETVVVLMVCVLTAYALGSGLSHLVQIPGVHDIGGGVSDITDDL